MRGKKDIIIMGLAGVCLFLSGILIGQNSGDNAEPEGKAYLMTSVNAVKGDNNNSDRTTENHIFENPNEFEDDVTEDVDYVEQAYYVATEKDPLSIREEPTQNAKTIGSIPKGTNVTVTGLSDNWGFVVYGTIGGWVNLNYCKMGTAPVEESTADNPTVWISTSNSAYSYHLDQNCFLLQKTTSPIKAVSLEYAKSHGHADPCNKCAGGQ